MEFGGGDYCWWSLEVRIIASGVCGRGPIAA